MDKADKSAGDAIPPGCVLIEVRISELRQLFNAIDASPFRSRDLDPAADEFIVEWAREAPLDAALALRVELARSAGPADEPAAVGEAVGEFYSYRSKAAMRRLRQLLRIGRRSLMIGLACLVAFFGLASVLGLVLGDSALGLLLRESVIIGGWVAMWRPLEIFLYGWWPIRAEARLYDRLSAMPVRIVYKGGAEAEADAWCRDWPGTAVKRPAPKAGQDDVLPEVGPDLVER